MDLLDNPIWHALATRDAALAEGDDDARRYPLAFTALAGLREHSAQAFASLAKITAETDRAGICTVDDPWIPDDWMCSRSFLVQQMVCDNLLDCRSYEMQILTKADVAEMKELVMLTQPGPFSDRTIELGTFLGIKDGTKLVAMGGERMKIAGGYDEVSAVCTHPNYQGRGYARAIVHKLAQEIFERGHVPFLHVRSDNPAGIRSYESIGFKTRREMHFAVLRRPPQV